MTTQVPMTQEIWLTHVKGAVSKWFESYFGRKFQIDSHGRLQPNKSDWWTVEPRFESMAGLHAGILRAGSLDEVRRMLTIYAEKLRKAPGKGRKSRVLSFIFDRLAEAAAVMVFDQKDLFEEPLVFLTRFDVSYEKANAWYTESRRSKRRGSGDASETTPLNRRGPFTILWSNSAVLCIEEQHAGVEYIAAARVDHDAEAASTLDDQDDHDEGSDESRMESAEQSRVGSATDASEQEEVRALAKDALAAPSLLAIQRNMAFSLRVVLSDYQKKSRFQSGGWFGEAFQDLLRQVNAMIAHRDTDQPMVTVAAVKAHCAEIVREYESAVLQRLTGHSNVDANDSSDAMPLNQLVQTVQQSRSTDHALPPVALTGVARANDRGPGLGEGRHARHLSQALANILNQFGCNYSSLLVGYHNVNHRARFTAPACFFAPTDAPSTAAASTAAASTAAAGVAQSPRSLGSHQ